MPYLKTHASHNAIATVYSRIVGSAKTCVSFLQRSVLTRRNRFPAVVLEISSFAIDILGPLERSLDVYSEGLQRTRRGEQSQSVEMFPYPHAIHRPGSAPAYGGRIIRCQLWALVFATERIVHAVLPQVPRDGRVVADP